MIVELALLALLALVGFSGWALAAIDIRRLERECDAAWDELEVFQPTAEPVRATLTLIDGGETS